MKNESEKPTVLVVDDEEYIVEMLTEFLSEDFRVLSATLGRGAIRILEREPIDVIISDQRMPDMTGIELLKRSIELQPDCERILITAYADLTNVIQSVNEAKVGYYLTKPIDPRQITRVAMQSAEIVRLRKANSALVAELQEYSHSLEAKVAERNAELQSANDELHRLHVTREQMIRMAVHDLKNPLANIMLALSELTLMPDESDTKELLGLAQGSAEIMNNLVHDMLSVATLNKVDLPMIPKQSVEPSVLLMSSVQAFTPSAKKKNITIHSDFSPNLPAIGVYAQKLREAIDNLVSNAIKYTPSGGSVTVRAWAENNALILQVQDTGLGMTAEDLAKAGAEFAQLSARPTAGESSTGLGLFIVKKVAELHGGMLDIASEGKNCGTTFTITLPLEEKD